MRKKKSFPNITFFFFFLKSNAEATSKTSGANFIFDSNIDPTTWLYALQTTEFSVLRIVYLACET